MPLILIPDHIAKGIPSSMIGPDENGRYYPLIIADHVMKNGPKGAIMVSCVGIVALAEATNFLANVVDHIAEIFIDYREELDGKAPDEFIERLRQTLEVCEVLPAANTTQKDAT